MLMRQAPTAATNPNRGGGVIPSCGTPTIRTFTDAAVSCTNHASGMMLVLIHYRNETLRHIVRPEKSKNPKAFNLMRSP
jgi:hypothetical protein